MKIITLNENIEPDIEMVIMGEEEFSNKVVRYMGQVLDKKQLEYLVGKDIDFIHDSNTYNHFYSIFLEEIKWFLITKFNIEMYETEDVEEHKKVENFYKNVEIWNKHWNKFMKQKQKFYLYEGKHFFYTGTESTSEPIMVFRLQNEDILNLLNTNYMKKFYLF